MTGSFLHPRDHVCTEIVGLAQILIHVVALSFVTQNKLSQTHNGLSGLSWVDRPSYRIVLYAAGASSC